jgi:glutaredoxin
MHPTHRLLQQSLRLTLFTRDNCSLCTTAKGVLSRVWDRRNFDFREIDVMQPGVEKWKALYEYDTPVASSTNSIQFFFCSLERKRVAFAE